MKLLESFILDNPIPAEIDFVQIDQDADQAQRLAMKVEAAKQFLGARYLLHPSQQVQRKAA